MRSEAGRGELKFEAGRGESSCVLRYAPRVIGSDGTVIIAKIVSFSLRVENLKVKKVIKVSNLNYRESLVFRDSYACERFTYSYLGPILVKMLQLHNLYYNNQIKEHSNTTYSVNVWSSWSWAVLIFWLLPLDESREEVLNCDKKITKKSVRQRETQNRWIDYTYHKTDNEYDKKCSCDLPSSYLSFLSCELSDRKISNFHNSVLFYSVFYFLVLEKFYFANTQQTPFVLCALDDYPCGHYPKPAMF